LQSRSGGGTLRWLGSLDEPATVTYTGGSVNGVPARLLPGGQVEADIPVVPGANTVTLVARDAAGNQCTNTYDAQVPAAATTYSYDSAGNLSGKTELGHAWGYVCNATGKLQVTLDQQEVARFGYDPLGRRVEKVAGGVTTSYVYDGMDILRKTVTDAMGSTVVKYVHGPGIDEPLAEEAASGTLSFFHADGLGSIVGTTNAAGTLSGTVRYEAWGNIEAGVAAESLGMAEVPAQQVSLPYGQCKTVDDLVAGLGRSW
jgi:YD repeat-containing protein